MNIHEIKNIKLIISVEAQEGSKEHSFENLEQVKYFFHQNKDYRKALDRGINMPEIINGEPQLTYVWNNVEGDFDCRFLPDIEFGVESLNRTEWGFKLPLFMMKNNDAIYSAKDLNQVKAFGEQYVKSIIVRVLKEYIAWRKLNPNDYTYWPLERYRELLSILQ